MFKVMSSLVLILALGFQCFAQLPVKEEAKAKEIAVPSEKLKDLKINVLEREKIQLQFQNLKTQNDQQFMNSQQVMELQKQMDAFVKSFLELTSKLASDLKVDSNKFQLNLDKGVFEEKPPAPAAGEEKKK